MRPPQTFKIRLPAVVRDRLRRLKHTVAKKSSSPKPRRGAGEPKEGQSDE